MSLHQIIYTSCKRGRNSANDGQQVYSYDEGFSKVDTEEVNRLFAYQHPTCRMMTEELAAMQPRSFTYRTLDKGWVGLAMSTYLGRDYMGSAGRFGNHLSHVVLCRQEELPDYPCRYYGSEMLRTSMDPEEVNNPGCPDFLPTPVLTTGSAVDVDAVVDFLGEEDRMEVYLNMLCAMLRFESERKRVVICDTPENIILWIGALEFALPLNNVRGINFTTYEYDPALSASQICGVVPEGTAFTEESRQQHFVFDLLGGRCEELGDKDPDFFDFVDTAMSFSFDALVDFHAFLTRGYTYTGADERICDAYALYAALSDGFRNVPAARLKKALAFADEFAKPEELSRIVQAVFQRRDYFILCPLEVFLTVTDWLSGRMAGMDNTGKDALRSLSVDRILSEFSKESAREEDFRSAYKLLEEGCRKCGFSLATELMRPESRPKLFAVMERNVSGWKIGFIVQVVSDFVKDQRLPVTQLAIDAAIGQTYYGIVKSVCAGDARNGQYLVKAILDAYAGNGEYLIHMALSLEGMLLDMSDGALQAEGMWNYYDQLLSNAPEGHFSAAERVLYECRRYDRIYQVYTIHLACAKSFSDARKIYEQHYENMIRRDKAYAEGYTGQVLSAYYEMLRTCSTDEAEKAKRELFQMIVQEKLPAVFADDLMRTLLKRIPLRAPEPGESRTIQTMVSYTCITERRPLEGKLLLLMIGMTLDKVRGSRELKEKLEQIAKFAQGKGADLSRLTERGAEDYLEWTIPNVFRLCGRSDELGLVYDLLDMPDELCAEFFGRCWKLYLKEAQSEKEYERFCEFLVVALEIDRAAVNRRLSELLHRLNRQKTENLDREVRDFLREDEKLLPRWEQLLESDEEEAGSGIADLGKNIARGLGGLFRKRKDKNGD